MKAGLSIAVLLVIWNILFAQGKYDANWCFGIRAGINFKDTANPINFITECNQDNAAASISDSLGNLLFYIAPDSFYENSLYNELNAIYNSDNEIITNGDSINEGSALTGAIFLPQTQSNSYYLLYLNNLGWSYCNLCYAKIARVNGQYQVIEKNIVLSTFPLEWRIAAVKHANGNDWWIIVHESNTDSVTNTFYKFLMTENGILGPYQQNIGSIHSSSLVYAGEMTFSKTGAWLAVALEDQNAFDLFNFNRCNGQLENYLAFSDIEPIDSNEITGCEFSEDESKLYIVEGLNDFNQNCALFQYSLNDLSDIAASRVTIYQVDSTQISFGDVKRGTDDKIYLAVEYSGSEPYGNGYNQFNQYLWVIHDPDSTGTACNFQPYGYYLGDSARVYWALPNMPNYNLETTSIWQSTVSNDTFICKGDTSSKGVVLTVDTAPGVSFAWQLGPGIINTTLAQQAVNPTQSTWYYVTFTDTTIQNSCQSRTDSVLVRVICCDSLSLTQCALSKDTFICTNRDTPTKGAVLVVDTVPGISFAWQPAGGIFNVYSTQQIVDPSQSTWYYVTFFSDTNSNSCTRTDSVYVEVRLCDTLGLQQMTQSNQHLTIYPNPAQNLATIDWQPINEPLQFSILDLLGREVNSFKEDGNAGKAEIDISNLANGLYVVRVLSSSGGGVGGGKLSVLR